MGDIGRTAIYHHFADKEAVVVAFATHETSAPRELSATVFERFVLRALGATH